MTDEVYGFGENDEKDMSLEHWGLIWWWFNGLNDPDSFPSDVTREIIPETREQMARRIIRGLRG